MFCRYKVESLVAIFGDIDSVHPHARQTRALQRLCLCAQRTLRIKASPTVHGLLNMEMPCYKQACHFEDLLYTGLERFMPLPFENYDSSRRGKSTDESTL
jgi:hypothetical protein